MNKRFAAVLACALLFTGCDGQNAPSAAPGRFVPGVYQGVGQGYGGEITVEVEVNAEDILSLSILSHSESRGGGELDFEQVPAEIIREGAPYVESVAGATLTSEGIMEAAADALKQAGVEFDREQPLPESRTEMELYTDILVAGGGGAGLTAANAAYENGAETVILLEKEGIVGGETAYLPEITIRQEEEAPSGEGTETLPSETASGYDYAASQRRQLEEAGGEILTGVELTGLLVEDGRVLGARARGENTDYIINTRYGVLLATGSYGGNREMVLEGLTDGFYTRGMLEENFRTLYGSQSSGDGIVIAKRVGAAVTGMKQVELLPGDPETGVSDREDLLLLSPEGERLLPGESPEQFIRTLLALPEGKYYALADADDAAGCPAGEIAEQLEQGTLFSADSLEELARQLELPLVQLTGLVEQYNREQEETGRLDTAPYYAAVRCPVLNRTLGGLLTDEDGRVMSTDGTAIPGLYAAGSVTALADDLGEAFRDEYTRSAILPRRAAAAAMQAPVERRLPEEAASQAE